MQNSQNLTIQDAQVLSTCIELVTTLVNLTQGSGPNLTVRYPKGFEFIHIAGQKHYPILVNEHLFKFLHVLWACATVFAVVFIAIGILGCLSYTFAWFCHIPEDYFDDPCATEAPANNTELEFDQFEFETIKLDRPFVQNFTNGIVLSRDNHFQLRSFNAGNNVLGTGHCLQIVPKIHCEFLNCSPELCDKQHIQYVHIPCHCSHTRQIKSILPSSPLPVDYRNVLSKHLKEMELRSIP
jgi:hypothetical protein